MAFDPALLLRPQKVRIIGAGAGVGGVLTEFEFDASIREQHALEFDLTTQPIEDGREVAEAMVERPRPLSLEVVLTRDPDIIAASFRRPDPIRHVTAWQNLQAIAKAREPVWVVTSLETYSNMMLLRLGTVRSAERTHALVVDVDFRKIEIETIEMADNLSDDVVDFASSSEDLGAQGTEAIEGLTAEEVALLGL